MKKKIAIIIACLLVIFLLFLARGLKNDEEEISSQESVQTDETISENLNEENK